MVVSESGMYSTASGLGHMVPSCGTVLKAVEPSGGDVYLIEVGWSLMVCSPNVFAAWPATTDSCLSSRHETLSSSETEPKNILLTFYRVNHVSMWLLENHVTEGIALLEQDTIVIRWVLLLSAHEWVLILRWRQTEASGMSSLGKSRRWAPNAGK